MNTTDDRDGDLLRALRGIDGSDGPPPRYDLDLAMRQGDSIRVRRMSLGAFVAVAVVALAIGIPLGLRNGSHHGPTPTTSTSTRAPSPAPSSAGPLPDIDVATLPVASCTTLTLTAPASVGAFTTWASGSLDPTGHYLAATLVKPFSLPASAYLPGKALLVNLQTGDMTLIPAANAGADGVNANGVVIGSSGPSAAGWVYRNGKVTQLPKYRGVAGTPFAINARGDIVGQVTIGNTTTSLIWPANHPGTVRALLPKNLFVSVITDNGTVGGMTGTPNDYLPYVGDGNGNGHTLPTGATDPRGEVYSISGDYAAGWALNNFADGLFPMVWNLTTGARTPYPRSDLYEVANDGTVVGGSNSGNTDVALIGHNGVLQRLPTGAADNLSVDVDNITADGHTMFGVRYTTADTSGPITKVGVLWRC